MIVFTDNYRTVQFGDGSLIHKGTVTDVFSGEAEALIIKQGKARKAGPGAKAKIGGEPVYSRRAQIALADGDKRLIQKERKSFDDAAEAALKAVTDTEQEAKRRAERKRTGGKMTPQEQLDYLADAIVSALRAKA